MAEFVAKGGTWINVDFVPARTLWGGILMSLQYVFFRVVSRIESKRCFDESEAAAAAGWTITKRFHFLVAWWSRNATEKGRFQRQATIRQTQPGKNPGLRFKNGRSERLPLLNR
jgi:hypothetical protein